MADILFNQRLSYPPPEKDSSKYQWQLDVMDAVNALPPTSTFSFSTPNSNVTAQEGTIGVNLNPNAIYAWIKESGNTNIGWEQVLSTSGISIASVSTFGDGTNYLTIASDGELRLAGTAKVWQDRALAPSLVKLPGANPPAEDVIDGFQFQRYDDEVEESSYYQWTVPTDFATGSSSVRGHYALCVENPPSGGGDQYVIMGFEHKKISTGDVWDFTTGTSSGTVGVTLTDGETAFIKHISETGYPDTTGWEPHDTIMFRFYRDATAGEDTYTGGAAGANDAWVGKYHIEWLSDSLGTTV